MCVKLQSKCIECHCVVQKRLIITRDVPAGSSMAEDGAQRLQGCHRLMGEADPVACIINSDRNDLKKVDAMVNRSVTLLTSEDTTDWAGLLWAPGSAGKFARKGRDGEPGTCRWGVY